MRQITIQTNLAEELRERLREPGPRIVVGPPGADAPAALATLIADEARGYHEAELEVARRRLARLDAEWDALMQTVTEFDTEPRTGARIPVPPFGSAGLELARQRAREHVAAAEERLAAATAPDATAQVAALLAQFDVQPRADLDALRAGDGAGQLLQVQRVSWALVPDLDERLAIRRLQLDLPPDQDWWEPEPG